jgi:hypothetical protein
MDGSPNGQPPEPDGGPGFGETLFSGSRFVFWGVMPAVVGALAIMNMVVAEWTPERVVIIALMDLLGALFVLGLYDPVRFHWANRIVCASVFLAYLSYVVNQWVFSDEPFRLFESKSNASPRNALLGLIIIGVPCLLYSLTGSFRPGRRHDGAR